MRRTLGVDFGTRALCVSVIDSRFRIAKPVKWEEAVLPEKSEDRDPYIVELLRSWKKTYAPAGVTIGIPLNNFSHQFLDMPSMGKGDMRKALTFELEKYLPLPVEEYVFDFVAMPGAKGRLNVLVFSIKKELIEKISGFFREAGLAVISIRCSTICAFSGLLDIAGEKRVDGVFVNATADSYEIAGVRNSLPVYLKGFSKQVALIPELERLSVLYPGKLYFMGNIDPSITEKFRGNKYQILVSHSIAISEIQKNRLNHNFSAGTEHLISKNIYPYLIGGFSAAAVVVYLLTGLLAYYKDVRALESIEKRKEAIKQKAAGVLESRKKLELLQADRTVLMDFQGRSNIAIKALSSLSEVLPKDAWLINFSADEKGKIDIEGFAGAGRITDLVVAVEKSKSFKNVSFSAPIIAKEGEERFALKMEVED